MKPTDLRNETFERLQARLRDDMRAVLEGYRAHGPCTTAELAAKINIGLLTVRPRTTDLCALGLVVLDENETARRKAAEKIRCGVYRAATEAEVRAALARARGDAAAEQMLLTV